MFKYHPPITYRHAFVVFQNETSLWWLKALKPGFRHCYILFPLPESNSWLELNAMSNFFFFTIHHFGKGYDYISELRHSPGISILETEVQNPPPCEAPRFLFTCVEFVKRCLGIHERWVITPWQLYKKLQIVGKKS